MGDIDMETIQERLRAQAPRPNLETLIDLNRPIPRLDSEARKTLASTVSSLFYIDTVDLPDFSTVVDLAVKVVAGMGPGLIPYHLQEMQGTDFKALLCFSRVLAALGTDSINPIVETCKGSAEKHLLVGAVYALSKIRDESVLTGFPLIVGLCGNVSKEVRDTAVRALGKLIEHLPPSCFSADQRERAFETLMAATCDSSPGIRAKGVRGLGKMENRGLLNPAMRERTQRRIRQVLGRQETNVWDTAYIVRREAQEALEYFAG